ncbi:ATP-binding protein [Streptomyces sp. WAC 06725]|uniref:ATP-binding protein n=1 Tax=Streptomyces sp. WAC 06725 TaxID=2203209 RepID=UPI00163B84F3
MQDPQSAAESPGVTWMRAKLATLGIAPDEPELPDTPEPVPALEAAQRRIPYAYREAVADHADIAAWVHTIAAAAVAPHTDSLHPHHGGGGRRVVARGPSLLLWGPTGTGKTHQAYGAIRSLTAMGCAVRWHAVKAADLYGQMRPRPGVDVEWMLRDIVRIPLLLLDDLGAAKNSEWTEELTFRLLAWRDENRLPTLVTSNLAPVRTTAMDPRQPVLRDKVGDRVLSRLSGMCTAVEFHGPDRRFAPCG